MANNRKNSRQSQPIDRYNYVDRDIYSSSGGRRPTGNRYRRKKKSAGKRVAVVLVSLVLVLAAAVGVYATVMLNRVNRTPGIEEDLSKYTEQPSAAPTWDVINDDKVTNILLIGTDKGDDGLSSRSDTTMLVSIDNRTTSLRLVSFLRDMYLEIPTLEGKHKFNAAYANGGAALTMQTLENNFRIQIDKYVEIDFENFEQVIDKMGGIDIDMSAKSAAYENEVMGSNLHEGVNHLDGRLALYYARIRDIDSDFGRTGRQRQVILAMLERFKGLNPIEMNNIAYDYLPHVTTNLSNSEILYLISLMGQIPDYEQQTMHIPNDNTFEDRRIDGAGQVLYMEDLTENCTLLRNFLYPTENSASGQ